jgi:GMP reductase
MNTDVKLDFSDVLIVPQNVSTVNSRADVRLVREFPTLRFRSSSPLTCIPIMAANMDTTGTFEMAKSLTNMKILTALHKHYDAKDIISFFRENPSCLDFTAISSGIMDPDFEKLSEVISNVGINIVCIDAANGHLKSFTDYIAKVRKTFPFLIIIAGNAVTPQACCNIISSGANIVKIGIGSGSVCTTRLMTGVGYPQLSAIMECVESVHRLGGFVMSDGGCVHAGDLSKAFCAGADFVMLGGMLSGHAECSGTVIQVGDKYMKEFYGMSSSTAMNKHYGEVASYRSSEGKRVLVDYKGDVSTTMQSILGGIRSSCTYINVDTIENMVSNAKFIRVLHQVNTVYGERP